MKGFTSFGGSKLTWFQVVSLYNLEEKCVLRRGKRVNSTREVLDQIVRSLRGESSQNAPKNRSSGSDQVNGGEGHINRCENCSNRSTSHDANWRKHRIHHLHDPVRLSTDVTTCRLSDYVVNVMTRHTHR